MTEGVHLPAHGKFPVWGWYLIGGLIVYVLIKKNSSVASMVVPGGGGSQALASDVNPRQAQAEGLQLEQLKKQFAYQDALAALDLKTRTAQSTVVSDYAQFYDDLATGKSYGGGGGGIMCPEGKPRIDPATGRVYCRTKAGGGFHWDDAVKLGLQIYGAVSGVPTGGSVGKPRVGTPPINPNGGTGGGGYAPTHNGGVSIANYTGGSMVTPASVLWCDNDC